MKNNASYVYEENEYEEGLTFAKVGHFFKKGWLRMLIYALVVVVVASIIVLPIKVYYKSEAVAQTSIEYIYDGIEKGENPNGGQLDTNNVISTTVLDSAVKAAKLDGVITDISGLRENMRVESVISKEYKKLTEDAANGDQSAVDTLRDYTEYPTRFNVIISEPKKLGLSDSAAKNLLDEIIVSYKADFKRRFAVMNAFASDSYNLSENALLEFTDIYDLYTRGLSPVSAYLDKLLADDASFTSTVNNETFTTLKSKLDVLMLNYTIIDNYVLTNSVFRDKKSAKIALQESKTRLEGELESLTKLIERIETQLGNWAQKSESIISPEGGMTVVTTNDKEYIALQKQLTEYKISEREYTNNLNSIDMRLSKITDETPTDKTHIDTVVGMFKAIEVQTTDFIEKVNATVNDYYDTTFVSQSVRQVQPPVVRRKSADFNILLIYAVAVLAALLAGGIVTGAKISRATAAAKKVCAEEEKSDDAKNAADEK